MIETGGAANGRVHLSVDGPVATLVLDDPVRRNAMGSDMYASIPDLVADAVAGGSVRVLVVRGADRTFCAGSNIAEFADRRLGDAHRGYDRIEHEAAAALEASPVPVVAAIHGVCMGGGVSLALCADLRYAADDAVFAVPPGRLGVGYPVDATARLAEVVGRASAAELLLTARRIDAAEALRIGLVHEVVPADNLDRVVAERCADVASLAPLTLRAARAALAGRPDAVELAAACFHSDDLREGLAAFEAGRRPEFRGR